MINKMKLIVVVTLSTLAVVVASGLSKDDAIAAFQSVSVSCMTETGGTDDDLASLLKHERVEKMEAKCLHACILKNFNVMDANGKYVKDVAMKFAELYTDGDPTKMQIADEVLNICMDITVSDNHCEAVQEYAACLRDECKKRGTFIMAL